MLLTQMLTGNGTIRFRNRSVHRSIAQEHWLSRSVSDSNATEKRQRLGESILLKLPLVRTAVASIVICAGALAGAAASAAALAPASPEDRCARLAGLTIPAIRLGEPSAGAVVVSAQYRRAESRTLPGQEASVVYALPDYCEVRLDILPRDRRAPLIHSQINLPRQWNGKKLQFGGSGYNGFLQSGVQPTRNAPPGAALPLARGYMTAGTDSGHQLDQPGGTNVDQRGGAAAGDDPRAMSARQYAFAANDEALRNFAYAAYKKTHDAAVALGVVYYGRKPIRSYYFGASEGGREALVMAQRYPRDFDGIVAIDPVMNWTGLQTFGTQLGGQLQAGPDSWLGKKAELMGQVVRQACDAADGIEDTVISNPKACVAPVLAQLPHRRCASGRDDGTNCFSDNQIALIRKAYAGYDFKFPLANGITHYAGYYPGGETLPGAWSRWQTGSVPPTASNPDDAATSRLYQLGSIYVRHFIARDAGYNPLDYDPALFRPRVEQVSGLMDATNPDLRAFRARGGKLILREDLSDSGQAPGNALAYHDAVAKRLGKNAADSFFLAYVAAGLPHTSGGIDPGTPGAPQFGIAGRIELLDVLEGWVEHGRKPGASLMLSLHDKAAPYRTIATRPMCRYGTWAHFVGQANEGADGTKYVCRP